MLRFKCRWVCSVSENASLIGEHRSIIYKTATTCGPQSVCRESRTSVWTERRRRVTHTQVIGLNTARVLIDLVARVGVPSSYQWHAASASGETRRAYAYACAP